MFLVGCNLDIIWFLLMIFSRLSWVFLIKERYEVPCILEHFIIETKTQFNIVSKIFALVFFLILEWRFSPAAGLLFSPIFGSSVVMLLPEAKSTMLVLHSKNPCLLPSLKGWTPSRTRQAPLGLLAYFDFQCVAKLHMCPIHRLLKLSHCYLPQEVLFLVEHLFYSSNSLADLSISPSLLTDAGCHGSTPKGASQAALLSPFPLSDVAIFTSTGRDKGIFWQPSTLLPLFLV